jgi:hypothetical protein
MMGDGGQLILRGSLVAVCAFDAMVSPPQQSREIRLAARRVSGTYNLDEATSWSNRLAPA